MSKIIERLIFNSMLALLNWLRRQERLINWLHEAQYRNRHDPDCPQFDVRQRTGELIVEIEGLL